MIVEPKVRNYICTTAHPTGCREAVKRQIDYVRAADRQVEAGPKRALVIGASTGYGLATRIALAFGSGTETVGVSFERPASGKRTASAGFYNNGAFMGFAKKAGIPAWNLNGDAFSAEMKDEVVALLKDEVGPVDLLVYSLAAPRRVDEDGNTWTSVIKPVGQAYEGKTLDLSDNSVGVAELEPATPEEIESTVKVMGGEDWAAWVDRLKEEDLLTENAVTLAYSYIGPEITRPIYTDGSIGEAKKHLYRTSEHLNARYADDPAGLRSYVAINKAVVTQSSAAIPSVGLYIALLFKRMKADGSHEGCIEQMHRMITDKLYHGDDKAAVDDLGFIRMDDLEMDAAIQRDVAARWEEVTTENVHELADIEGYWNDFYELFGFGLNGVDYNADVEI